MAAKSAGTISKSIVKNKGKPTTSVQVAPAKQSKQQGSDIDSSKVKPKAVADRAEIKPRTVGASNIKQSAAGDDRKTAKSNVQARIVSRTGRPDLGVTLTKRDPSKYKAMFDKMKQLESKDTVVKEQLPVAVKPHTPKKEVSKPLKKKLNVEVKVKTIVDKKKKTEKVKEKIKQKAKEVKKTESKKEKLVKPKATGKKLKVDTIKSQPVKESTKKPTPPRSVSSSVEKSVKSPERPKTTQKSEQASKKRSLDPRDAIPKFEKFHRKPRAHTEEPPVSIVPPKVKQPKVIKPKKVVEEVAVESKRSPQKTFDTPQQSRKQPSEKKSGRQTSHQRQIVDDIGLDDMLGSSSKAQPQVQEAAGFSILTGMMAAESPQHEAMDQEDVDEPEVVESPKKQSPIKERFSSHKKASLQKSVNPEESHAKTSASKRWNQPTEERSAKKIQAETFIEVENTIEDSPPAKSPSPVKQPPSARKASPQREASHQQETSPEREESAKEASPEREDDELGLKSATGEEEEARSESEQSKANESNKDEDDDDVVEVDNELDDFAMAMLSSSKNRQETSEKKASARSTERKNEAASLGILMSSFAGDDGDDADEGQPMDQEDIEEAEEQEEDDHSQEDAAEESGRDENASEGEEDKQEDSGEMVEEDVDREDEQKESSIDQENEVENVDDQEVDEIDQAHEVIHHEEPKEEKPTTRPAPGLFSNQHSMFSNPTGALFSNGNKARQDDADRHQSADKAASVSSVDSRREGSSGEDRNDNGRDNSQDRDVEHVNLEPLSSEPRDNGMMFNKIDEDVPMNLESAVQRSRTETPDKAFHDSALDHHKLNSNSKQNDGTDFSFY